MSEIRYFEDIKNELTRDLNRLRFVKNLWEKVEIKGARKEGGSQLDEVTIENAELIGLDERRPILRVSGFNPDNNCEEKAEIWLFWKDDGDLEMCDAVGTRGHIGAEIINLDISIACIEKELEILETVFNSFSHDLYVAIKNLKENCDVVRMDGPCRLEYLLVDLFKNRGNDLLLKSDKDDYDCDIF